MDDLKERLYRLPSDRRNISKLPIERFWSKVAMIPFHACWEWIGKLQPTGYGRFTVYNPLTKVSDNISSHRLSYIIHNGENLTTFGSCTLVTIGLALTLCTSE